MNLSPFKTYLIAEGKMPATVESYLQDLRSFSRWYEDTNSELFTAQGLTPTDARQYKQFLLTVQKAKPATINRRFAALRAFSAWAIQSDQIDFNPLKGVKDVEEQDYAPRWLAKKEQAVLVREAEKAVYSAKTEPARRQAIRDKCAVTVLLNCGLRVGELSGLDMSDVKLSDRKGEVRVRQGKGEKERTIPLNATAREAIQEWIAVRPTTNGQALFIGKRGERMSTSGLARRIGELGRRAKLKISPHDLRHSFCKNLIANVSIEQVAALAGHKRIQTSLRYTTPSKADLEHAVSTLNG
jgi:site-specific recombinase XerD